jgi:hypothetical protein
MRNEPLTPALVEPVSFSVSDTGSGVQVDPVMLYGTGYGTDTVMPAPRISRRLAMQVPAVKRARDLICGSLGTLPLELFGPDNGAVRWALFDQPEPDVPRSVTMTRTFEDMFFEGVAWWYVTDFGWHGYPTKVRRLDPATVTVVQNVGVYTTKAGNTGTSVEWLPDERLIRFDSPNDPLLISGARAIRTLLTLDAAASRHAEEPLPTTYFTSTDDLDPQQDEIDDVLDEWKRNRQTRSTGYVPSWFKLNTVTPLTAEQMQLAESREHAVLDLARATGVDPEDLGVSTTSRTYFNAFDRKQHFANGTLGGYRQAFEDRLSMGDVTARGYSGRLNLDAYMRTDALSRYQAYAVGLQVGAITRQQIAAAEGVPDTEVSDGLPDAVEGADAYAQRLVDATALPPGAQPTAQTTGGTQ